MQKLQKLGVFPEGIHISQVIKIMTYHFHTFANAWNISTKF